LRCLIAVSQINALPMYPEYLLRLAQVVIN